MSAERVCPLVAVETALVAVPRMARLLERHGDRGLQRLFTPAERAYARRKRRAAESLAARLAAKLAARRALLRIGLRVPALRDLEVRRHPSGEPTLGLDPLPGGGEATGLHVALSLTHDADFALATLLLEERRPGSPTSAGTPAASC